MKPNIVAFPLAECIRTPISLRPYQEWLASDMLTIVVLMLRKAPWHGHPTNKQGFSCTLWPARELPDQWKGQPLKGVLRALFQNSSFQWGWPPAVEKKLDEGGVTLTVN